MIGFLKRKKEPKKIISEDEIIHDEVNEWLSSIEVHHMPDVFLDIGRRRHPARRSKLMIVWIAIIVLIAALLGVALFIFFSRPNSGVKESVKPNGTDTLLDKVDKQKKPLGQAVGGIGDNDKLLKEEATSSVGVEKALSPDSGKNKIDDQVVLPPSDEDMGQNDSQFSSEEDTGKTSSEVLKRAADSDGDGLSDLEEALYSTNSLLTDSDRDGYSDGVELLSLHDPTQGHSAQLKDSSLVREYVNPTFGYAVFFPSQWSVTSSDVTARESIFQSATGETFEVSVLENDLGINDSQSWYLAQFPGEAAGSVSSVVVNGFSGVMSGDGLTVYFVSQSEVYILSYNLQSLDTLNYFTTFGMFTNSFRRFENPL